MTAKSDLGIRTLSAIVMLAVAGGAIWLGGYPWIVFVTIAAAGVLLEWVKLSHAITRNAASRLAWFAAGLVYVGLASLVLIGMRLQLNGMSNTLAVIGCVIATDVGAYFVGRIVGGPKIAPSISPSKTWAGLAGGMCASALVAAAPPFNSGAWPYEDGVGPYLIVLGAIIAIVAQLGDFFESWMKRRAGVKDSSRLIPGHGGLFDRVDGLLAVLFGGCAVLLVANIASCMERFL